MRIDNGIAALKKYGFIERIGSNKSGGMILISVKQRSYVCKLKTEEMEYDNTFIWRVERRKDNYW